MATVTIKKYGNRRLYDTGDSRYITLDELASKVHGGADVRVVDDKTGEDLTQATLTQIILENRNAARMLPVPLLNQLIRLGDDALGEFFGRYMTLALEGYLHSRRGVQALAQMNPLAALPFGAGDAIARMFMGSPLAGFGYPGQPVTPGAAVEPSAGEPPGTVPSPTADDDALAAMRRDLDELRQQIAGRGRRRKKT